VLPESLKYIEKVDSHLTQKAVRAISTVLLDMKNKYDKINKDIFLKIVLEENFFQRVLSEYCNNCMIILDNNLIKTNQTLMAVSNTIDYCNLVFKNESDLVDHIIIFMTEIIKMTQTSTTKTEKIEHILTIDAEKPKIHDDKDQEVILLRQKLNQQQKDYENVIMVKDNEIKKQRDKRQSLQGNITFLREHTKTLEEIVKSLQDKLEKETFEKKKLIDKIEMAKKISETENILKYENLLKERDIIIKNTKMSQSENIRIIKMSNEYYKMIEENEKYKEDLKNEFQVYINIAINNISKVTTIIDNIEDERTNINENEKEDIDNLYKIQGDYKFIANIKGFENLNNSLTNLVKENKKLNVDNNLLKMKIVDVQKELTKIKKNFSAQDEKIKNSTIKIKKIMTENHSEIVNLCQYIFF